jgi:nitrate/nitrite-specific signal transduction histidine kinase
MHSHATNLKLYINFDEDWSETEEKTYMLEIRIQDDGIGMDLAKLTESNQANAQYEAPHIGLQFMRYEVARLNGLIDFFVKVRTETSSTTESGTTITLTFPHLITQPS